MWWITGALTLGMIAVHMAKPRGILRKISSFSFFDQVPPPTNSKSKLRLSNPMLSKPFYFRILALALFIAALFLTDQPLNSKLETRLHVWALVDTSASMSTRFEDGSTAMEQAKKVTTLVLAKLFKQSSLDLSLRLSTFDYSLKHISDSEDVTAAFNQLGVLKSGFQGTNLNLVHGALSGPMAKDFSHALVITDQPAPSWVGEFKNLTVVWLDISKMVQNTGITRIEPVRNPLTGLVSAIRLELTSFGPAPATRLTILDGGGNILIDDPVVWQENGKAYPSFSPAGSGFHTIAIEPGGAYIHDDQAIIRIPPSEELRVDWRAKPHRLAYELGEQTAFRPHIRITDDPTDLHDTVPTLVIGGGAAPVKKELGYFLEGHPLLMDLNFDALAEEPLGSCSPSAPWAPILKDEDNKTRVAMGWESNAIWIPGLLDGEEGPVQTTLFFNALRFLLQERPLEPLYTTTVGDEEPEDNRIALHKGEGNTWRRSGSFGNLDDLRPVSQDRSSPMSFLFLTLALGVMAFERDRRAFGGSSWR